MGQDGMIRGNHRRIVRVIPTLSTDAYATGDVLFNGTEIPNAVKEEGGCSKLIAMYTFNKTLNACKYEILFTENTVTLGTINATANISDADIATAKPTGFLFLDESLGDTENFDNFQMARVTDYSTSDGSPHGLPPVLLQASSGSTSCYVSAVIQSGTPTFDADDLELIFHIEY
tara:strand:+ start:92 stop:613 length:522 start_codon:yes stop_codon:yes gene_type:complete